MNIKEEAERPPIFSSRKRSEILSHYHLVVNLEGIPGSCMEWPGIYSPGVLKYRFGYYLGMEGQQITKQLP
jgi:hypothetical protein